MVISNKKYSLVIAGAGSGKSYTIIAKIKYLIDYCNYKPKDILCISFTNEATNSLKSKLLTRYNLNIECLTFHKLALLILNNKNYKISPDNYLELIVDNFFKYDIHNNKVLLKKYKKLIKIYTLNNLKKTIITFINLFKSQNYKVTYFKTILKKTNSIFRIFERKYNKPLLLFIINIYLKYEYELNEENAIDFNDMINKSIEILKNEKSIKSWKYIIIDEFQDTSLIKINLLQELLKLTNANLLTVGDDFQSIYRFTGCNLNIFLNINNYFKNTHIFYLKNTYRCPQELINVAGSFIMKNKYQTKKQLISNKKLSKPIKIYYTSDYPKTLISILNKISNQEILVIGRNNNDIYNYINKDFHHKDNIFTYKDISFKYLTAHKSKGLESDNTILINMTNSITGFPSQMTNDSILKYVNNQKSLYPFDEERRLFYVALTRTKNYCYIIVPYHNESIFIKEIKKYKKYIQVFKE